jgi:lysophospholipase L1-like esterase
MIGKGLRPLPFILPILILLCGGDFDMKHFLFLGDSITDSFHDYDTDGLGEGYVRYLAEQLGYGQNTVSVTNLGKDGSTSEDILPAFLRAGDKEAFHFISVLVGVNDALQIRSRNEMEILSSYQKHMTKLIETLKKSCPDPSSILLIEPFSFPVPSRKPEETDQIGRAHV